jgi:hypothetical protein
MQRKNRKGRAAIRLHRKIGGAALVWIVTLTVTAAARGQATPTPAPSGDPPPATTNDKEARELAERLLKGESKEETEVMARVVALMVESRRRLHQAFDPGPETQAVQREILKNIDDAIETALRQRSKSAQRSSAADPRRMPDPDEAQKKPEEGPAGDAANEQSGPAGSDPDAPERRPEGPFKEAQRGWGHLPAREREEIIQGIGEDVLEGYRELVERYYRALAEEKEPAK